jgi:dUTP pyrophosphatase
MANIILGNSWQIVAKRRCIEGPIKKESVLKFVKISIDAYPPKRGSPYSAGFDLHSCEDVNVKARGNGLVNIGIKIYVPSGTYGRIAPRSGLAIHKSIDVGGGVIDPDYRGSVKVILFNHSDIDFEVKKGDRVAQLICEKIQFPELEQVEDLEETERNQCGFGSTGIGAEVVLVKTTSDNIQV